MRGAHEDAGRRVWTPPPEGRPTEASSEEVQQHTPVDHDLTGEVREWHPGRAGHGICLGDRPLVTAVARGNATSDDVVVLLPRCSRPRPRTGTRLSDERA